MKTDRRRLLTFASYLTALLVLFFSGTAGAQMRERKLVLGIGLNEDHPQGLAVKHLADTLRRESGGKIQLALMAGGKVGNDLTMIRDLQKGTLAMTVPDSSTLVGLNKGFGVINMPFLFEREDDADSLLDGAFGTRLLDSLKEHGIVGLGWWENGFRSTTNNVRPIAKAKDFEGIRIRVIQNPLFREVFKTLGAEPVEMPFPEVFNGLKDKKVEGQENPVITIYSSRFFEVQKYLSLTRHIYSAWPLLISKKTWDDLSPDEQNLFRKAAREATLYERKTIREAAARAIAELQKAGMIVNEPTPATLAHFRQLLRPVNQRYRSEFGQEWIDELYLARLKTESDRVKAILEAEGRKPAP